MTRRNLVVLTGLAVLIVAPALLARQNILSNGSMESGPGQGGLNPQIAADWTEIGENVERSPEANQTGGGGFSLKAFGDPTNPAAGGSQEIEAAPGQIIDAGVWLFTRGTDKLGGTGQAGVRLEFLNQFGGIIGGNTQEMLVVDSGSAADTWIEATVGPHTAPAGTVSVRITCLLTYTVGNISGSVYWDDVVLTGTTGTLLNGDFETAGVSADANPAGIDDWSGFNDQQKSDEAAYHGTSSVKVGTNDAFSGLWQNMGTLQAGDEIHLVARVMHASGDPLTGSARAGIKLEFDPPSVVPPPEEVLSFDETATPDQWTQVTLQITVPDGVTIAKIVCIYDPVGGAATTGSVYFDQAEASLNGGGNLLANDSFENDFNALTDWEAFFTSGSSQAVKSCFVPGVPPTHGSCMLKTTGTAVAGVLQKIDVTPGDTLDIAAWLRTPTSDQLTGPGQAGIKVEWAAGNVPPDVDIGGSNNTITAVDATDVWHELTIDFVMPAGSEALARFTTLVDKGTATSGAAYFDVAEAVVVDWFPGGSDGNADDDADLADFAAVQECFSGDGGTPIGWPCFVHDADEDGDVDLADHATFMDGFTGP
ncbi:MAG: hypothetical protein GY778_08175 [bacterium]|nr:hypothetical protein [bacterium]